MPHMVKRRSAPGAAPPPPSARGPQTDLATALPWTHHSTGLGPSPLLLVANPGRPALFDPFLGALVGDLAEADFVEGGRHRLVRVDALCERRRAVVELLGALGHDVDQVKFRVDVPQQSVEVAEYAVTHGLGVFQFF